MQLEFGRHMCVFVSFRCQFVSVEFDLLFIQNPQATSSKYATCISVLFFPLWDVKLLRNLSIIFLWVEQSLVFISLILPHLLCFWGFFRDSQSISLEIFQQIAGEYITPKLVASRGKITMLLKSVQISQQHCSCHLLTICENLLWGWTPSKPFVCAVMYHEIWLQAN